MDALITCIRERINGFKQQWYIMKKNVLVSFLILVVSCSFAQDSFEKKWLVVEKDTLPYRLLLPPDYNPKKEYPLILFLHGAGERGNDNEKQLTDRKSVE